MTNYEIRKDMEVVGADGEHVGTVDGVEGDQIKLTRNDSINGQHNFVSTDLVESCENEIVTLSEDAEDVIASFGDTDIADDGSQTSAAAY